jgi:hypothetical protein
MSVAEIFFSNLHSFSFSFHFRSLFSNVNTTKMILGNVIPRFETVSLCDSTYRVLQCAVFGHVDAIDSVLERIPFLVVSNQTGRFFWCLSLG